MWVKISVPRTSLAKMALLRVLSLPLLLLCENSIAKLLTNPSQLSSTTYDFVIVGGALWT